MILGLLLGCNNGGEERLAAERRLGEIGKSAENAFYSFVDFIADTLGFRVTKDKKKENVGTYFSGLGKKIEEASNKLEGVAEKSATDGDKDSLLSKAIREAVDAAKTTLIKLKGHLDNLGTISTGDSNVVGWSENSQKGVKVAESELNKAFDALKGIVTTAETQQVKGPSSSSVTLQASSIGIASAETGSKILGTDQGPGAAVGDKAALIVSAVSGEKILESIVKSKGTEKALSKGATAETTPFEFALGGNREHVATADTPKAAAIAGGIALRSLIKDGKLAAHTDGNDYKAVHSVGGECSKQTIGSIRKYNSRDSKECAWNSKTKNR